MRTQWYDILATALMQSPLPASGFSSLVQPLNAWLDHGQALPIVVSGHSPAGSFHVTDPTRHEPDLHTADLGSDIRRRWKHREWLGCKALCSFIMHRKSWCFHWLSQAREQ